MVEKLKSELLKAHKTTAEKTARDTKEEVDEGNLQRSVSSFPSLGVPTVSSSHHGCWQT